MTIDLELMSRKELRQLGKDVEKAIKNAEKRERKDALEAAERAAAEYGFELSELSDDVVKRKSAKVPKTKAKYRNPDDPKQTWSGRGRKPQWIHDALAKGTDITDLEI
ncbi:H-NS histone family protein [Sedimentitalea todarodis]|uniref:H-NS histone family protein n=1 Tax=Sedimentitalea todarodis TaxID=1631240 RepID=A0ABU3VI76_9RHOB|nr:H-NS histone family protein [Sedimentitalea todarodis]MDU9005859.1 H-NS histone family protein [Sedimentitalea todarodis]